MQHEASRKAIQRHALQSKAKLSNATQSNAKPSQATENQTVRSNATQVNTTQCKATQSYGMQGSATQSNVSTYPTLRSIVHGAATVGNCTAQHKSETNYLHCDSHCAEHSFVRLCGTLAHEVCVKYCTQRFVVSCGHLPQHSVNTTTFEGLRCNHGPR